MVTVLRLALVATFAGLALAACGTPDGGYYGDDGGASSAYYPGTSYPRAAPAPAPAINGIPQNPGSGGGG